MATTNDVGKLVRPNHVGDGIDYRRCVGRLVEAWDSPGTKGEPVGTVIFITGHPWGRVVNGYPLAMLEAQP
jgi:hypothetical protein